MLGRGADDDKVDERLRAAPRAGLRRLRDRSQHLVGRPQGSLDGSLSREDATQKIADNYLRFVKVYAEASKEHARA